MSPSHDTAQNAVAASTFVFTADPSATTGPPAEGPAAGSPSLEPPDVALDAEEAAAKQARTTVWDVPFDRVTLRQAVDRIEQMICRGKPGYVVTANLNYVMLHHRDPAIRPITEAADLILADGQPIVWRSKLGPDPLPERVAGSEMIYHLAQQASLNGWGIYFLGGEPGVAATCAERLADLYPGLKIAGVESPPFRQLTPEEQQRQYQRIGQSGAKLLLVAFGQPKGERWIHQHYRKLGIPVSIQLGASFDFIAGTAHRAPQIWQRLGLEWAHRMISDPRRLVPRYAANARFLIAALAEDWKRKVTSWGMGEWSPASNAETGHRPGSPTG